MSDFLRRITEKDPIISTASVSQMVNNPKQIENYYSEIASTHMAIGGTDDISRRLVRCLIDNQKTFNGAVVGEYGFGKTSLLIYLWNYCLNNAVLAIPPYQWSKFMDHFQVIYSWTKYQIGKQSPELSEKFDVLFKRRIDPSIEVRAKVWADDHQISFSQAKALLQQLVREGTFSLELNSADLMGFCSDVSEFLVEHTPWRGLLVITDELQQTISELNRNTVFDYLFDITNHLAGARGNYGFLWGFPLNTHADLGATRGDILDRMNSNGVLVRLSEIYDRNFPMYLWNKYCQAYDINQEIYPVVDMHTLTAIGQVCDGARKDIGNGPRSTISAFNVMAQHYLKTQTTYRVGDFVDDCLNREIKLGETSDYVQRVNELLALDNMGGEYGRIIKFLAAFPFGVPDDALKEYGMGEDLDTFIKFTGGLGRVVVKNITSYMLKIMRPKSGPVDEPAIEREIRQFYSEYSPDVHYMKKAQYIFNDILEKNIFTDFKGAGAFEKWSADQWTINQNIHECVLTGSFDARYPERKVCIATTFKINNELELAVHEYHLKFCFVFADGSETNKVIKINDNTYKLNLNLMYQNISLGMHQINDIVPEEKHNPLFFMCLIEHLNQSNIPNDEFPARAHLIKKLKENIIYNLFNEEMLGEVDNSEIELDSQGEHLIQDLFTFAMQELYPEYATLMFGRNWKNKILNYVNALNHETEGWSLMQKRGKEEVSLSANRAENKEKIAALFGQSSTNFESWLSGMNCLLESRFDNRASYFRLKCHPLEQIIIDAIQNEGRVKYIIDRECKCLTFDIDFAQKLFRMGYLLEEIEEIIKIGKSRKYFNIDESKRLMYMKPEDKDELKDNCRNFAQLVKEQIELLNNSRDYISKFEELAECESKIDAIESSEQAERIQNQLKQLQSYNKYYASKEIENLKTDAINLNRQTESKNNDLTILRNKLSEMQKNTDGKAPWIPELLPIFTNLDNELVNIKPQIETAKRNISACSSIVPLNNKEVVKQLVETRLKINAHKENWAEICRFYDDAEKRIGFLGKWIQIKKTQDQILDDLYKYSAVVDDSLKGHLDLLNANVGDQLKNNQKSTLENNEQYYVQYNEIKTKLYEAVSSSKTTWGNKCEFYESKFKEITGKEPDWHLRWSGPAESYGDLYQRVAVDLRKYLDRLELEATSLNDDIIYSIEVLNHKRAIQNKNIDSQLKELLLKIDELKKSDIDSLVKNQSDFEPLVEELKQFTTLSLSINREHRNIVQPIKVEDAKELSILDLIGKDENVDLKKIIISYQKKTSENIDLTTSRDDVLALIKELFLKKQITISIKKGKF